MKIIILAPLALEYLSKEFQNDKDIVSEAVKICGYALEYASETLKNDKDIVLLNGMSLKFASDKLKKDKKFVSKVLKDSPIASIFKYQHLDFYQKN